MLSSTCSFSSYWNSLCSTPVLPVPEPPSFPLQHAMTCRGHAESFYTVYLFSCITAGHSQTSYRRLQCIYQYNGKITMCYRSNIIVSLTQCINYCTGPIVLCVFTGDGAGEWIMLWVDPVSKILILKKCRY